MGIFSRMRDIVSSNINAMLEKAEDPEKLIKLMIQEMEDTLVEVKAACAGAMATRRKVQRENELADTRAEEWGQKAELAVSKGREDLAREALVERRRYRDRTEALTSEAAQAESLVVQYKDDIGQLEEKLNSAREKHRMLVQRHIHARQAKQSKTQVRRAGNLDAMIRFDNFENRIERLESEADLVDYAAKPSLEEEFKALATDDDIERELTALKEAAGTGGH